MMLSLPSPDAGNGHHHHPHEETEAYRNMNNGVAPFYKIVLTGGPCGGKTTALERVSSYLRERGFEVITSPETFTILASNGLSLGYFSTDGMDSVIQNTVMDVQMSLEDGLERILKARGKPAVLICDRGAMDGAAYLHPDKFKRIIQQKNLQVCDIREGRYNAVYHMVTAADGAEQYYTLENNGARTETAEEARELDEKTRRVWVGHPKLAVFDNSTDFEGKLQRLVNAVSHLVGLPTNLRRVTTKFLLRGRPNIDVFPEDIDVHIFDVEKVYLVSNVEDGNQEVKSQLTEEYSFIRKRTVVHKDGTKGGSVYGVTSVQLFDDGKAIEVKRIITAREYNASMKTRDLNRHIVRQQRISFLYNLQSFSIHVYEEPLSDLCILHAQAVSDEEGDLCLKVDLPPFLDVERCLKNTKEDNEAYGAFSISLATNGKSCRAD